MIGINLHADWGDLRNIKWLKNNTIIKNIRLDFPCKDYYENPEMIKHMNNVLDETKDFETILIHTGYLKGYDSENYQKFSDYITQVSSILKEKGLNNRAILELWNNINLGKYWLSDKDYAGFKKMLDSIYGELDLAKKNGIKIAGFSFTLNHDSSWKWLHELKDWLKYLNYTTIQIYPEKENQYIELIDRFRDTYQELDYIVAETGHYGNDEGQLCKYRQLMYEIEKATPDKFVFLYHLFDWNELSHNKGWELINWKTDQKEPGEKSASIYLKYLFDLKKLEEDKPGDFYCCSKNKWWKKFICFFRRIF